MEKLRNYRNLMLPVMAAFIVSCGAVKKNKIRESSSTKITETFKKDSVGVLNSSKVQSIEENKIVENKTTYESESEYFEVEVKRNSEASDETAKKLEIITPKGKYVYGLPKGYDFNIKNQNDKKAETQDSKEKTSKNEKVKDSISQNSKVSGTGSKKSVEEKTVKNKQVEKKEPIWFNVGFWVVILIIITASVLYFKFYKR